MPETNKVVICVIRSTCPIPGSENSNLSWNKAREPGRAAAASRREKRRNMMLHVLLTDSSSKQ